MLALTGYLAEGALLSRASLCYREAERCNGHGYSQSKREATRGLLAKVSSWFSEGFEAADLLEAKALLEALS
jgi:hypothetical protein